MDGGGKPLRACGCRVVPRVLSGRAAREEIACNQAGPLPAGAPLVDEVRGTDVIGRDPAEPGKVDQPSIIY